MNPAVITLRLAMQPQVQYHAPHVIRLYATKRGGALAVSRLGESARLRRSAIAAAAR